MDREKGKRPEMVGRRRHDARDRGNPGRYRVVYNENTQLVRDGSGLQGA